MQYLSQGSETEQEKMLSKTIKWKKPMGTTRKESRLTRFADENGKDVRVTAVRINNKCYNQTLQ